MGKYDMRISGISNVRSLSYERYLAAYATESRSMSPCSTSSGSSGKTNETVATPYLRSCGCPHRFIPGDHNTSVRDRRRSRSRTSSSPVIRSRTSSLVSSERTTPPPGPLYRLRARTMSEELLDTVPDAARPASIPLMPHRFKTTCYFEPQPIPVQYSSSVIISLGSTRKHYIEKVAFQTRLVPKRFSEGMFAMTECSSRRFTSGVEIQCIASPVHIIALDSFQQNAEE